MEDLGVSATMNSFLFCFISFSLLSMYAGSARGVPKSNKTDQAALLEFKNRVPDDPHRIFSSWNDSVDFCHWPGITCSRRHLRVTRLELPGLGLGGSLSPYIGNLSFLRVLNVNNNSFTDEIPQEIGNLRRLMYFGLESNSFSDQFPENISGCSNLQVIRLSDNMLVGEIPQGLIALLKLRSIHISKNNLMGNFPKFFGNFSSLESLSGSTNNFVGTVPASFGRLQKLKYISLGENHFSGTFPSSIFNITSLEHIGFPTNQLEGSLPPDLGIILPNLLWFNFASNHLTGPIPPWIANTTNLLLLDIAINNFSGSVPDLKNLNQLQWLAISVNQLGSGTSGDLRFVESLNSTDLWELAFNDNNFGGTLPRSIGNLSSELNTLWFGGNKLTGPIPSSIGNLRNLEHLNIDDNQLTGIIPDEIGNLRKLKRFGAQNTRFTGEIPPSLGNLTMLTGLSLAANNLSGSIPTSLGNCQDLIELYLSQNKLSGTIPLQVLSISSLSIVLDLSQNELSGALPDDIRKLNNLAVLWVHSNKLSGEVPDGLSGCTSLVELYMGNNLFEGNIFSFLSPLRAIQYLDLSQNNFSGQIPKFLENFQLIYLNLSFNRFEGEVPTQGVFLNSSGISVMGNGDLCGGISVLNLPSCPPAKLKRQRKISPQVIISIACGSATLVIGFVLLIWYIWMRGNRRTKANPHSEAMPRGHFLQISYENIVRATEGFNQRNLIGAGSFGSVYKGILENEDKMVAIKVLDLRNRGASKSFMAECEALRNIRHRNLVKIVTACSSVDFQGNDFKALVYEYMENGSLEEWLHLKVELEGARGRLSLICRLCIAIDIACAMEYLHHECETPIIHCDLKPSNVLLDAEMTAHVGDFGLARIVSDVRIILQSSSIGVRGTIGYSPPEYGMGSEASREGDVYNYGILLLEMFTGKRPTDDMFKDTWNLRSHCETALPGRVAEIADPALFSNESREELIGIAPSKILERLVKVFEIGIMCCQEAPRERIEIREAVTKLRSIKASVQ